jgi:hypothetical protein
MSYLSVEYQIWPQTDPLGRSDEVCHPRNPDIPLRGPSVRAMAATFWLDAGAQVDFTVFFLDLMSGWYDLLGPRI